MCSASISLVSIHDARRWDRGQSERHVFFSIGPPWGCLNVYCLVFKRLLLVRRNGLVGGVWWLGGLCVKDAAQLAEMVNCDVLHVTLKETRALARAFWPRFARWQLFSPVVHTYFHVLLSSGLPFSVQPFHGETPYARR